MHRGVARLQKFSHPFPATLEGSNATLNRYQVVGAQHAASLRLSRYALDYSEPPRTARTWRPPTFTPGNTRPLSNLTYHAISVLAAHVVDDQ